MYISISQVNNNAELLLYVLHHELVDFNRHFFELSDLRFVLLLVCFIINPTLYAVYILLFACVTV